MPQKKSAIKKGMQKRRGSRPAGEVPFSRRTITLSQELESAIDDLVGPRMFSAFAQEAFEEKLQRERIVRWLEACEAARGGKPLEADAVAFAEAAWRARR